MLQIRNIKNYFAFEMQFKYFYKSKIGDVVFTNATGAIISFPLGNLTFKFF